MIWCRLLLLSSAMAVNLQVRGQGTATSRRQTGSVVYVNQRYGFRFRLPSSWAGYSVLVDDLRGQSTDIEVAFIKIRHPLWTKESPREDIPIEVFRRRRWKEIESGDLSVSAAPFPPNEIGRNRRYVFALDARYSYDELPGVDEVRNIMKGHPLQSLR